MMSEIQGEVRSVSVSLSVSNSNLNFPPEADQPMAENFNFLPDFLKIIS